MPVSVFKGIPIKVFLVSLASMLLSVVAGRLLGGVAFLKDEAPLGWATGMTMFYVSFYNASGFTKWWKLRDTMGAALVAHRDMASKVAAMFDLGHQREELKRRILVCLRANMSPIRPVNVSVNDWMLGCKEMNAEEKSLLGTVRSPNVVFSALLVKTALGYLDADERPTRTVSRMSAGYTVELCKEKMLLGCDDLSMLTTQTFPKIYPPLTTLLVYISLFLTPVTLSVTHPTASPCLSFISTLFLYGTFTYVRDYLFSPFRHGESGGPVSPDTFDVAVFLRRTVHDIEDLFANVPGSGAKKKKKKEHTA